MALSDYEKKMLAELEAQLTNEDPSFARNMKPAAPEVEAISRQLSVRNLVLGILGLVAGIAILIGGISAPKMWWLGLLGVIIMFASVWYALAGVHTEKVAVPAGGAGSPSASGPRGVSSFMQRQQEIWEKRRRGEH